MKEKRGKVLEGVLSMRQVAQRLGLSYAGVMYIVHADDDFPVRYVDNFYVIYEKDFEAYRQRRYQRTLVDSRVLCPMG